MGHDYSQITKPPEKYGDGWEMTGFKKCERCGKEAQTKCHYCNKPIGKNPRVVMGYVTCEPCGIEHEKDWDKL